MAVLIKSVKARASANDGVRVLVERQWPAGISKERASAAEWLREVGPSEELARWFRERPTQWPAFRKKYLAELTSAKAEEQLQRLHDLAATKPVTLVHAWKEDRYSHAKILKDIIDGRRKPPSSTGPVKAVQSANAKRAPKPR